MERLLNTVIRSPLRSVLASSGEVEVGAYARRQRRRRMLLACVGVLMILGAGILYWLLRPYQGGEASGAYPVWVRCSACNGESELSVAPATAFPLICPLCHERAARQIWQCANCGRRFVLDETTRVPACPACNSLRIGTAATRPSTAN